MHFWILVIVMLSAIYTFVFYPVTLCVCVDYSTTAATAIANRNGLFSYYINYKFLQGKGKMQNIDAEWKYA